MRPVLAALALVLSVTFVAGCPSMGMASAKGAAATAKADAKKDCAACEKMCAVAGDAEKNPGAVESCKADCKKSCTP